MAGDQRTEVIKYDYLKKRITSAICIYSANLILRPPLEGLQETVRSMEPMVKEMEVSLRESPRHIFMTDKLLPLLERAKILFDSLLKAKLSEASSRVGVLKDNICRVLGIEVPDSTLHAIVYKNNLEIIRETLKNLFRDYVQEELEILADQSDDQEVVDERELKKLLNNLLFKIRDESSKPSSIPVFTKLKVILDSLGTEITDRSQPADGHTVPPHNNPPQLLHLLKEVKLLHRFLNGDHGLSIPDALRERELALRKFVRDNVVMSHLKQLDQQYEKEDREKWISILFLCLVLYVLVLISTFSTPEDRAIFALFAIGTFVLACLLAMEVYTLIKLGQSHAQGQISNSDNWNGRKKYEIFLNFRGDIRFTVPGVFHTSLEKENISSFFDERNSRKSKRFLEEIGSAISTSLGAITIFSEHYGDSEYCLDELLLILEREKTHKSYIIRPIFYDVEPDDLTAPNSKFGLGLQKLFSTQPEDKVEKWKQALNTVTSIGGDVYKSDRQHLDELVNKVVKDFKNQLGK